MAEVILIRPGYAPAVEFTHVTKESRPPAGLLYIAAPLVQQGFDVFIIDQSVEQNWEEKLLGAINKKTICVGITCLTGYMIFNGIDIAKIIRNNTLCPIVWGEVHPSLEPDTTIESEYVDVIVEGKGEETFLELVEQLKLDDIVFYHGRVSHETIAKEIDSIDVGLIPNKRKPFTNINMPTRIFEYLCNGKPVIAPRTRGILDYFEEDSLYFFEPGSIESLAEVILDVYGNPERRCAVLVRGISIYQKYRWQLQQECFVGLVTRLLGIATLQIEHKKT